jgi:hypothetical protein
MAVSPTQELLMGILFVMIIKCFSVSMLHGSNVLVVQYYIAQMFHD